MMSALMILVLIYLTGNNSLVLINVTAQVPMPLVNITLPVEPLGPPVTVVNDTGQSIPYYINNNELIIPVVDQGNITIEYTPYIEILNNGTLQLQLSSNYEVQLFIGSGVLPTSIPNNITNFRETSNGVVITLAPGNYTVNFITTNSQYTTQAPNTQQTTKAMGKAQSPYTSLDLDYAIVIAFVVLIIIALMFISHRKEKTNNAGKY
ncbi:hypothetical protein [Vulcanisaeta souniana]|uniref:hypothetical protein n=1 Tax=Vulcanisaeta souniana TaxID=164452 RepID=UPI0006D26BF8|nr:hypothetical protein [Vulcanisaeta souniana]